MQPQKPFLVLLSEVVSPLLAVLLLVVVALALGFLSLNLLHSIFIWAGGSNPERAFHRARTVVAATSSAWNSARLVYNGALNIGTFLVPSWNLMAKHSTEPLIWISLEVVSQIFAGSHYDGIIEDQGDTRFRGHRCGTAVRDASGQIVGFERPDDTTAVFCTLSPELWAETLQIGSTSSPTQLLGNDSLVLSVAQARRMQELLPENEGDAFLPVLNLGPFLEAIQEITGVITLVLTTGFDIFWHVVYTVLSEAAALIFNAVQTIVRSLAAVVMAMVSSGALKSLLTSGLDLIIILVVYVALPLLFAALDTFMCIIDFVSPAGWPAQLRCIERTCFKEDGDIGAEVFTTFSSLPVVGHVFVTAFEALINPATGRAFASAAVPGADVPDISNELQTSAAAATCASCYTCRVPELRAIFLLIAMTWGCLIDDAATYSGNVENMCLDGGAWYAQACGERGGAGGFMTTSQWANTYTKHLEFDTGHVQHTASLFRQLAIDSGGPANAFDAQLVADAWFQRDVTLGDAQAASFYRAVCRRMRIEYAVDGGPQHVDSPEGSMGFLVGSFLYEACKRDVGFDTCSAPIGMSVVDGVHELRNCLKDMPYCRREREQCLGQCGGNLTSRPQDYFVSTAKTELSVRVLGSDRMARGRANCTSKHHTLEVELFPGLTTEWASRWRVRGGFAAINAAACNANPIACAAVQRVLERDPTLTFLNGRFVHSASLVPPPPLPPPLPPPGFTLFGRPSPAPYPPTPSPPPPWYAHAEQCLPVITAAEADTTVADGFSERAVCVFVQSVVDERIEARRCFEAARLSPSPPPPPPMPATRAAARSEALLARRVRRGGANGAEQPVPASSAEAFDASALAQQQQQLDYLTSLSNANPQLRSVLGGVVDRLQGRRLWQRADLGGVPASHDLADNLLISTVFGNAPVQGVTLEECQALCAGIVGVNGTCVAVAYARMTVDARDLTLRTCYLLRATGGCTPSSFAAQIFARRDTDACVAPSQFDNPLCVQLARGERHDLNVITYDEGVAICRNGRGRDIGLARPQSFLEAFSFVGYARERGVHAFWADAPRGQLSFFTGVDGERLNVSAGERRCVLVQTVDGDVHGHMYASLRSCHAKLADGVVCESASAAPPPPPSTSATSDAPSPPPPPPPPPPPLATTTSLRWFSRSTIAPLTQSICLAGLAEHDLGAVCTAAINQLALPTSAGLVKSFVPLCTDVCWHACTGTTAQDRDGFLDCRHETCADTTCFEFLRRCDLSVCTSPFPRMQRALTPPPPMPMCAASVRRRRMPTSASCTTRRARPTAALPRHPTRPLRRAHRRRHARRRPWRAPTASFGYARRRRRRRATAGWSPTPSACARPRWWRRTTATAARTD